MNTYYSDQLSAERLRRCYEIAPGRVRQYLTAEVEFVCGKIRADDVVLELGCGYGRVLHTLAAKARAVVGIDTSFSSLVLGREVLGDCSEHFLVNADAARLAFRDHVFDVVVCIQNGISAFHVDQKNC